MSQHLPPLRRVDLQIRPGCGQAYTVEVRYGDLDTLGHVNNVAMVRVLEEGRSRMVADHRLFDGLDGLTPHVVGHQIDYMGKHSMARIPPYPQAWPMSVPPASGS